MQSPATPTPTNGKILKPVRALALRGRLFSAKFTKSIKQFLKTNPENLNETHMEAIKRSLTALNEKIANLDVISKSSNKRVFELEFQSLQRETLQDVDKDSSTIYTSALKPYNRKKNRYMDVLPFEESRVILTGPHRQDEDGEDYINANYILDPSDASLPTYIATQGPLDFTVADFWDMAKQEHCVAVISLTKPSEDGRSKCSNYFPKEDGNSQKYDNLRVTNKGTSTVCPSIVERVLEIRDTDVPDEAPFNLRHYQYLDWPDHGVPVDTGPIRNLMRMLRNSELSTGPYLIHCSAGIGRTGTYILIDHTVRKLIAGDDSALDIVDRLRTYRAQRNGLVQTKDQFRMCYTAIRDELRTIIDSSNFST